MTAHPAVPTSTVVVPAGRASRLASRPWRAFLLLMAFQGASFGFFAFVLFTLLRLPPRLSDMQAPTTAALFTLSALVGYGIGPWALGLPNGRRAFRGYLDDLGVTVVRPAGPLVILTASCVAVVCLCQGGGAVVYRLTEGRDVTWSFVRQVFDLGAALPPQSMLLFAQLFSALEELPFRGVLLTMLLARRSARAAILLSAAAFGLMHLPAMLSGSPPVFVLGQSLWAFLFGLFYGYLFVRTGSLLPSMVIHWLSNVFQDPLTAYWATAPIGTRTFYGVVFGYGLAAVILIPWVRFFADRWIQAPGRILAPTPTATGCVPSAGPRT